MSAAGMSRETGLVQELSLVSDGGSLYHRDLILDGGTGDLFKFNNGGTFVHGNRMALELRKVDYKAETGDYELHPEVKQEIDAIEQAFTDESERCLAQDLVNLMRAHEEEDGSPMDNGFLTLLTSRWNALVQDGFVNPYFLGESASEIGEMQVDEKAKGIIEELERAGYLLPVGERRYKYAFKTMPNAPSEPITITMH